MTLRVTLTEPADSYEITIPSSDLAVWGDWRGNCDQGCDTDYVWPFTHAIGDVCPQIVDIDGQSGVRFQAQTGGGTVLPGEYWLVFIVRDAPTPQPSTMCIAHDFEPLSSSTFYCDGQPIPTTWIPWHTSTPCCFAPGCTGDVTGDCEVNMLDLLGLLAGWEDSGSYGIIDLLALLANWGSWCSP